MHRPAPDDDSGHAGEDLVAVAGRDVDERESLVDVDGADDPARQIGLVGDLSLPQPPDDVLALRLAQVTVQGLGGPATRLQPLGKVGRTGLGAALGPRFRRSASGGSAYHRHNVGGNAIASDGHFRCRPPAAEPVYNRAGDMHIRDIRTISLEYHLSRPVSDTADAVTSTPALLGEVETDDGLVALGPGA